ncbi:MAG: hypothetical protein OK452_07755 [Thaumarchaeota archaeon]|nr:hypothetical protein [Nitrososphaerota archaeon]
MNSRMRQRWTPQWAWRCPNSRCETFLKDILPHLRIKKQQALLILELIRRMKSPIKEKRKGRGGSAPLTAEELSSRRELRNSVRRLNTKGSYSRSLRALRELPLESNRFESEVVSLTYETLDLNLLHWMAGFFDPEGSIGIQIQIRENRTSPRFALKITIANSNIVGLYPFIEIFGGRAYLRAKTRVSANGLKWSDIFYWYCPQDSAMKFTSDMANLLIIKRPQALLGRRFLDCIAKDPPEKRSEDGRFARLTPDKVAARKRYHEKMLVLNSL